MPKTKPEPANNGRRLATPQSVDAAIKSVCDIMRRSNCAGALQYLPELTWILFLRILDEREMPEEERARAVGAGSDHSWTVERNEIEARGYDLKAVNPNAKREEDLRTPEELLDIIEAKGREVAEAIASLRRMLQ